MNSLEVSSEKEFTGHMENNLYMIFLFFMGRQIIVQTVWIFFTLDKEMKIFRLYVLLKIFCKSGESRIFKTNNKESYYSLPLRYISSSAGFSSDLFSDSLFI